MTWWTRKRYPCTEAAPAAARRFCAANLTDFLGDADGVPAVIADAEVIVSELVTNAVNAPCTRMDLLLTADQDTNAIRIEVHDDGPGTPVVRRPEITDEHGRGLLIVAAVARDWGVATDAEGKTVWAEVDLDQIRV